MSADLVVLAGRILLGGVFVVAGLRHLMIVPVLTVAVAARGVPFPRAVVLAGTGFQIAAGLSFMHGFFIAWTALALILFTIVASVMLVNFWDKQGEERNCAYQRLPDEHRIDRRLDDRGSSRTAALNPDPERIADLEAGIESGRELVAGFVADQRQARESLRRQAGSASARPPTASAASATTLREADHAVGAIEHAARHDPKPRRPVNMAKFGSSNGTAPCPRSRAASRCPTTHPPAGISLRIHDASNSTSKPRRDEVERVEAVLHRPAAGQVRLPQDVDRAALLGDVRPHRAPASPTLG